jgi:hypothetical protein
MSPADCVAGGELSHSSGGVKEVVDGLDKNDFSREGPGPSR